MGKLFFNLSVKSARFAINAGSAEVFTATGYSRTLGYLDGSANPSFTGSTPIRQTFYGFQGWGTNGAPEEPDYFPQTLSGDTVSTNLGLDATGFPFQLRGTDFTRTSYLVLIAHVVVVGANGERITTGDVTINDFMGTSISMSQLNDSIETASVEGVYTTHDDFLAAFSSTTSQIVIGDTISGTANSAFIGFSIPLIEAYDSSIIDIVIAGTNI
jgi:hypothetical protein